MEVSNVRAVLFVKDLARVTSFYSGALGMQHRVGDDTHSVLECRGFELIVHQIPQHLAAGIEIQQPPVRRTGSGARLDYPIDSIEDSRRRAQSLGGEIDEAPPGWADPGTNFFLGCDPEGNVFGVSERPG